MSDCLPEFLNPKTPMKSEIVATKPSKTAEFEFPCLVQNERGTICLATSECGGVVLVVGKGSYLTVGHVFPPDDGDEDAWRDDGWAPITGAEVQIKFIT